MFNCHDTILQQQQQRSPGEAIKFDGETHRRGVVERSPGDGEMGGV